VSSTRERILVAARELLEQDSAAAPNVSAIARAVGISRQAVYLHFPDRASLLLALVAHVDEQEDLRAGLDAIAAAPDAAGQIHAMARMQAERNPRIAPLARALDRVRHEDQPVAQAWRDRTDNRMRGAAAIVERMRREGGLDPTWSSEEAAALLWELTSFRVWDDLVSECGLAADRYVEVVTAAALAALASPVGAAADADAARDSITA
jgi:AcrR family transcriptional regulator